jgi:hypothetical protein
MNRLLNRIDPRWLIVALMGASPLLRADGGCGASNECGKLSAASATFTLESNSCGKPGTLQVSAPEGSCGMGVSAPADSGLPSSGNRSAGSFKDAGWYLYGHHEGSAMRCTAKQASGELRLSCEAEDGYSCTVQLSDG